jgi:methionine aminopeptidase
MVRTLISFAAGFVIAGFVIDSASAKKFREVAGEKAAQLKSATQKAAAAAREEFCSKKEPAEEKA